MTKTEKAGFDSMVRKIIYNCRKQMYPLKNSKSGAFYVMIPLTDLLREINVFKNTYLDKKGKL